MPKKRVAVAMSGGVDSSVAAALLKEEGYDVFGVTMQILPSPEAVENARKVADKLGISHYVMDLQDIFARKVIADFCREYSLGRTPNPCVRCNQYIKFDALLDKVMELGAESLATGHYARIGPSPEGYRLRKAVDITKDQSYFLYTLGQRQLERLMFPVGELSQAQVRRKAGELGLPTANERGSQDICFIPDGDYRSFIAEHIPLEPGDIVDINGKVLGQHGGLAKYTVGQRQKLGLASGEQLYVLALDAASNRLVVGSSHQAWHKALMARSLSWVSGKAPAEPTGIMAKVRYRAPEVAAELHSRDGTAEVRFLESQRAIAPGQSVVFYQGDIVLGGGIIDAILH